MDVKRGETRHESGSSHWRGRRGSTRPVPTRLVTNSMIALDTNIWIYSHDTRDPAKQAAAQQLIGQTRPLALPWQVGCEFVAASRKLQAQGFSEQQAWLALTA